MARSVALLFLAILLTATAPRIASALSCGQVISSLRPCIPYASGKGPLTPVCCGGVRSLNGLAKTTPDRQTACNCLKSAVSRIAGLKAGLAAGVPGKCGVNIPYAISTSTNCAKVSLSN